MDTLLAESFIKQMSKQKQKRPENQKIMMDMRSDGIDFFAEMDNSQTLSYFSRGTRYKRTVDGKCHMTTSDGMDMPIGEIDFQTTLHNCLLSTGVSSDTGVGVLVKKHIRAS